MSISYVGQFLVPCPGTSGKREHFFSRSVADSKILYTFFARPQIICVLTASESRSATAAFLCERPFAGPIIAGVQAALQRSQNYSFCPNRNRKATGLGELMVDSTLVSGHWLRIITGTVVRTGNGSARRCRLNHLSFDATAGCGWYIYYGGPSEANATIKAHLALKLAGVSVKDPRMLKGARDGVRISSGVPR